MGKIREKVEELKKAVEEECGYEPEIELYFYDNRIDFLGPNKAERISNKLLPELGGELKKKSNEKKATFWMANSYTDDKIANFTVFHKNNKEAVV